MEWASTCKSNHIENGLGILHLFLWRWLLCCYNLFATLDTEVHRVVCLTWSENNKIRRSRKKIPKHVAIIFGERNNITKEQDIRLAVDVLYALIRRCERAGIEEISFFDRHGMQQLLCLSSLKSNTLNVGIFYGDDVRLPRFLILVPLILGRERPVALLLGAQQILRGLIL